MRSDSKTRINRCPVCRLGGPAEAFVAREMMFGLREEFEYLRCADCRSLWLANPPDDLGRFYGDSYYSMGSGFGVHRSIPRALAYRLLAKLSPSVIDRISDRVEIRPRFIQSLAGIDLDLDSRIADVGSGEGGLVKQLARWGFTDLTGIDPFIEQDRVEGPVELRKTTLAGVEAGFDLIMFHHSLEHIESPSRELTFARERIRSSGTVVVRLPVLGVAWDRYGVNWVGLDPPRHFFIPTVEAFISMAREAGFEVSRVFFDSDSLQFRGSERYLRGIPLRASGDEVPTEYAEMEKALTRRWDREARILNRRRQGDTAGFHLVPV